MPKNIDELMAPLVVRVPTKLRERLDAYAASSDLTLAQVARRALTAYLDAQERA